MTTKPPKGDGSAPRPSRRAGRAAPAGTTAPGKKTRHGPATGRGKAKPATTAARFRDRIVGLIWAAPARLRRHPDNWRRHPDEQRTAFREVLQEVGIADAAVAFIDDAKARKELLALRTREERAAWLATYKGKLMLIDGHLRRDEIDQPIPTLVLDVGPDEARKALATHDAVTALATSKRGALVALAERAGLAKNATLRAALEAAQQRYVVPLAGLVPKGGAPAAGDVPSGSYKSQFAVMVICKDAKEQEALYERLIGEGLTCKVVVT